MARLKFNQLTKAQRQAKVDEGFRRVEAMPKLKPTPHKVESWGSDLYKDVNRREPSSISRESEHLGGDDGALMEKAVAQGAEPIEELMAPAADDEGGTDLEEDDNG